MTTQNTAQQTREQKSATINDLIAITRDSAEFYSDAAGKVDNPGLKTLFTDMAHSKNGLIGAMAKDVKNGGGTAADSGTLTGVVRQTYGKVRAALTGSDYAFVSELEDSEDRLLHAMNGVLHDDDTPAAVKSAVSSYLPKAKQQHDLMRDRKWDMKTTH